MNGSSIETTHYLQGNKILVVEKYYEGEFEEFIIERLFLHDDSITYFEQYNEWENYSKISIESFALNQWSLVGEKKEEQDEKIETVSDNIKVRTVTTSSSKNITRFKSYSESITLLKLVEEVLTINNDNFIIDSLDSYYKGRNVYSKRFKEERRNLQSDINFFNSKVEAFKNK